VTHPRLSRFRVQREWTLPVLVAALLISLGFAGRLLDHTPNFTPMAAIALFAGFWFHRWFTAALVALSILIASNLILGFYEPGTQLTVYAALLLPIALRGILRKRLTIPRLAGCALGSSVIFFITTNFAVWLFNGWYARTFDGLVSCYAAALPFFRYTAAGDLIYTAAIFGAYAAVIAIARQLRAEPHVASPILAQG
jgi:hypothetical protein